MKKLISKPIVKIRLCLLPDILVASFLVLSSFSTSRLADDFLEQLGISKTQADAKITGSILNGCVDLYDVSNAQNIATAREFVQQWLSDLNK